MDEKKNRESPRINANRIFLTPACSAPAYRLRRNRTPSGKMLKKNRRAGFSKKNISCFISFFTKVLSPEYMHFAS